MPTQFVPLTLELIDEGTFLADVNEEVADVQDQMAKFRKQYGPKSAKAKGKLTIELEFSVEGDGEEDAFAVKSSIKTSLPKKPASVSLAMGGETEDGKLALFVRTSGSDKTHPQQLKLATQDGKAIDPDTGEVIDGEE